MTMVATGGESPNTSPCTRPTASQSRRWVTYIRVRTTSAAPAPNASRAVSAVSSGHPQLRAGVGGEPHPALLGRRAAGDEDGAAHPDRPAVAEGRLPDAAGEVPLAVVATRHGRPATSSASGRVNAPR